MLLVCGVFDPGLAICTLEPAARMICPADVLIAPALLTCGPNSATKPPLSKPLTSVLMLAPAWTWTPTLLCPGMSPAENSAVLPVVIELPLYTTLNAALVNTPLLRNVVLALASSDGAKIKVPFGVVCVRPLTLIGT